MAEIEETLEIEKKREVLGIEENIDYDTLLQEHKRDKFSVAIASREVVSKRRRNAGELIL